MKLHRFILDFNIKIGIFELKNKEFSNQFRNVLKLKIGEKIILSDGNLKEGVAEIKEYGKNSIVLEITEINKNQNESDRRVVLYCAVLKNENFELVVQKVTEIGIKEIVPIITERTVKLNLRKDRLEKIVKEAAEQSGRGIVPILHDPADFKKTIDLAVKKDGLNVIFDLSGSSLNSLITDHHSLITVFIGPEGGWSPQELEIARSLDFKVTSLGKTTLRAETAAIVGSFLVINNCNLQ